jgi:hypothetical protein
MPSHAGGIFRSKQLFLFAVLALLIHNAAGGFAGRLAGGLTLAAAAVLNAFAQVTGFDGTNSFHG